MRDCLPVLNMRMHIETMATNNWRYVKSARYSATTVGTIVDHIVDRFEVHFWS